MKAFGNAGIYAILLLVVLLAKDASATQAYCDKTTSGSLDKVAVASTKYLGAILSGNTPLQAIAASKAATVVLQTIQSADVAAATESTEKHTRRKAIHKRAEKK